MNRNNPVSKKFSGEFVLLAILFIISLGLFGIIVHEVLWKKEETMDIAIADFVTQHVVNNGMTEIMNVITFFGSSTFHRIGYLALAIWLFIKRKRWQSLAVIVIGVGGFLITSFLKDFLKRARPPHPLIHEYFSYSFPSGHASSSFIFNGLLAYIIIKSNLPRGWKLLITTFLILFSFLIGLSRIYLGVHYASDVIAGFCVGFLWLVFAIWGLKRLNADI
jgi:membrane-associated phospholipid phosphatase